MMRQIYNASEAAAAGAIITAPDRPMEAGWSGASATPERQKAWCVVANVSPHLLTLLDEENSVLDVIFPWSKTITPLRPANERRVVLLHWVVKLSGATNIGQGIWAEITTVEPIPPAIAIAS
jgi:hypothetical protein